MDYKELLIKYMTLVIEEESVTFIENIEYYDFTYEEKKELNEIKETVEKLYQEAN